jgi:hypothetical protein
MQIVYWAHSYREQDAAVNRHFGTLIEQAAQMIVNFDPPSESVNESKLQQNLSSCDGMVAVLPWRATGPSQYILFEIALALRSRKAVVVSSMTDYRMTFCQPVSCSSDFHIARTFVRSVSISKRCAS